MRLRQDDSKLRVAVLAGGQSAERAVSLKSGAGVASALEAAGHSVALVDPASQPLEEIDWSQFDAAFIALHGGAGEDGRIQAELARLGVPYSGSGPLACQLAMSKRASKQRFLAHGVPTPPFEWIAEFDALADVARRVAALGYPVIIKPDDQGSSIGIAVATESTELPQALAEARTFGGACLVEPLVEGREFTVALIDDRPLPLIEIVSPERVFSYDAKYHSSLTEYRFDFELPPTQRSRIERAAVGAAAAVGTQGLCRVDVMLDREGDAWVLEVNTVPGMTIRSLAPLAAARAGIDMCELCELLVRRCLLPSGAV